MEQPPFSLYELNAWIRRQINESFPDEYWLQAELSEVRISGNGHCYVEFVQKDPQTHQLVAKARGTVWSNVFRLLRPYFEQETGQALAAGIKVRVRVSVDFHELYGYNLTVTDIDPSYTMGDMARRRREILLQLEEEGVLDLNKELSMPVLPQRIAVISSATAAGYGDFCDQLKNNPAGIVFYPRLFPAILQGERVEDSVIAALNAINDQRDWWDVVVLIRGGGSTSDLSGFDTYLLAANCAQFPLPIITGIGHLRDDTVIDRVAHTRVKTPTAAAEFIISRAMEAYQELEECKSAINHYAKSLLAFRRQELNALAGKLPSLYALRKMDEQHLYERLRHRIQSAATSRIKEEKSNLALLEQQVESLSPDRLLKRGYSITLKNGCALTDPSQLEAGDKMVTLLWRGKIESIVEKQLKD